MFRKAVRENFTGTDWRAGYWGCIKDLSLNWNCRSAVAPFKSAGETLAGCLVERNLRLGSSQVIVKECGATDPPVGDP